jgi:hypothetical protein
MACKGTKPSSTGGLRGVVGSEGGPQVGVIVDAKGPKNAEATTDDEGRYKLELIPGTYVVSIPLSHCGRPKTIEVTENQWIDLDWKCWIKTP